MLELTEYEMILDAIATCREDGVEPAPRLLELKAEFEAGTRSEVVFDRNLVVERGVGHRPVPGQRCGRGVVRHPSDKQVAFVNRLLVSRVLPEGKQYGPQNALARFREGTANLRHVSDLIEWLLTLPQVEPQQPVSSDATEKQLALIKREITRRDYFSLLPEDRALWDAVAREETISKKAASHLIDQLLHTAYAPRPAVSAERLEIGIYQRADGQIFKVYPNQTRTHLLAKVLKGVAEHNPYWDYAGGANRQGLKAADKLTLEQAKVFGRITGTCCNCGRLLTDEVSIADGIGPICAKRFA